MDKSKIYDLTQSCPIDQNRMKNLFIRIIHLNPPGFLDNLGAQSLRFNLKINSSVLDLENRFFSYFKCVERSDA